MKIQVLGADCPTCKRLYKLTVQAVEELQLRTEVEYITDIQKMIDMGVLQTPVLAINGKQVIAGFLPDVKMIKETIQKLR
jgi:small redox-active disulfide protein 2